MHDQGEAFIVKNEDDVLVNHTDIDYVIQISSDNSEIIVASFLRKISKSCASIKDQEE